MSPSQVVWCLQAFVETEPSKEAVTNNWEEIKDIIEDCEFWPKDNETFYTEIKKYSNG